MNLRTGAKKGWWETCASMKHSREVSMAIMCFGNQSCQRPPTSSLTLEELQ